MADGQLEESSMTPSSPGELEFANYCWYVDGEETRGGSEKDPAFEEAKVRNVFKIYLNDQDAYRFIEQHKKLETSLSLMSECKNKACFKFQKQDAEKRYVKCGACIKRLWPNNQVCLYFRDYFSNKSVPKLKRFLGLRGNQGGIIHFSKITVAHTDGKYDVRFDLAEGGPCANARYDILNASIRTLMTELGLSMTEQRRLLKQAVERKESRRTYEIPALDVNVSLIRQILAQVTLPEVLNWKFPNLAAKDLLCETPPEDHAMYVRIQQLLRLLDYKRAQAAKPGMPESQPSPRPQPKAKAQGKSETKSEAKPQGKSKEKAQGKSEAKPQGKSKAKAQEAIS